MNKLKRAFSLISAETWLIAIVAMYTVGVVISNIFEMKFIGTEIFAFAGGGILVSWLIFAAMDIVTEVWGHKKAVYIFTFAAFVNVLVVILAQVLIAMPGSYSEQNAAFSQIFSNGPRMVLASVIAFWIGNFINSTILVKLKGKQKAGKKSFAVRAIISTIIGQLADNGIFLLLAFAPLGISAFEMPLLDILTSTLSGTGLETIIEAVFVMVTATIAVNLSNKRVLEMIPAAQKPKSL